MPNLRGGGRRLPRVVRLRRTLGDDDVRLLRQRLADQVLELAGLVAAGGQPRAVVALDPQVRAAEQAAQVAHRFEGRRRVRQPHAREIGRASLSSLLPDGSDLEHLAQVREVGRVVAHVLLGRIRQLRHRLAVAADHLDHDLQRRVAQVVGQVGADAEGDAGAIPEPLVQLDRRAESSASRRTPASWCADRRGCARSARSAARPTSIGSPESWRAPSNSLQKYMSKSRRNASMP